MSAEIQRFAAIDAGSNAIRLVIGRLHCDSTGCFLKREASYRVPLRLGDDAFRMGILSEETIAQLCNIFLGFKHLIRFFAPKAIRACATSAMREASNGAQVVARILQESGIALEIISGKAEAELLFANSMEASEISINPVSLYIDVGGGSTELTLMDHGVVLQSESFRIGTVRSLQGKVLASETDRMKAWVDQLPKDHHPDIAIGTGGNIGKIFDMAKREGESNLLSRKSIKEVLEKIEGISFEDRIRKLGLKPDRADVIVPAGKVYSQVMKWADIKDMVVPKVGVSDGILQELFLRSKA